MSKFIYNFFCSLAIISLFFGGSSVHAEEVDPAKSHEQTPSSSNKAIPLQELISEVLEKNSELKVYRAEIEAAKGERTTAGLLANPEAGGSIWQKKVWNEDEELSRKGRAYEASIMQTFEWPGRTALRTAIAHRNVELAELGYEQFRLSLVANARARAYEFLAAQEIAAVARDAAGHFNALREVLSEREPAGLTPLLEMRVIEATALNIQRQSGEASLAAQGALFKLNELRGARPDAELSLISTPFSFKAINDKKSLTELARSNDFLVRVRAAELERQNLEVGLAENERLPAVSVGPSFSQEEAGERERVMAVAVSMPLPLWNQNQGNIHAAKAHRSQAEIALDVARRDAERRLFETIAIYETKVKEIQSWQPSSIQHFKEASELADRHYRLGAVPVSVYVDLQTQYLDAISALHDTRKEALEAAAQLELITGKQLDLVEENK